MKRIEILNGNELLIRGGLEAGISLYTGYPGSPLADYFNILHKKKNELSGKGIRVAIANSEANAAAMASGAKQAGKDTMVAMKSMGLHVASDALSVGNFASPAKPVNGLYPGVVIAVGDDPWSMSTSTPADSRYLFKHLHIPFLEPSTPQELKDWVKIALQISKRSNIYQGLLLTTFIAEGGGRVGLGEEKEVDNKLIELDPKTFDLSQNVMVPPNSLHADKRMIETKFPSISEIYEEIDLDKRYGNKDSKTGIISAGVVFETLKQVLEEGKTLDSIDLYKLASPYPLVENKLIPFLSTIDNLIVVEEKRGFLESEIRALCQKHDIRIKIYGKKFDDTEGFNAFGGLSYEIISSKLDYLFNKIHKEHCSLGQREITGLNLDLPKRLPTFCPGCPHRETLSLLKELRGDLEKKKINLISHGDVGCYSLSFLEPFKEMHNLSAMGQGGALGAGVDIFTTNPSIVLMGDSTFFHSGLTDISNSVQLDHSITYIILDNDNTAMTGHQMTPRSGNSVEGKSRPRQNIETLVKGLGCSDVLEVNPSDRYFYKNVLNDFVLKSGVKIIISNKECGLTFHGRRKSEERTLFSNDKTLPKKNFYQINTYACEDCRECVDMTGCPGLSLTSDAYGSKIKIDAQICVSDSYCTKLKACPSFELVEVTNFHPSKYKAQAFEFDESSISIPTPKKSFEDIAAGDDYRVVVTGVGGSGVTTISRIFAEAAREMNGRDDLDFKFMDQKGLAQRNGNVTGHLCIYKSTKSSGAVNPLASADLLISPDLLDASNQLSFLSKDGEAIVNKDFQVPMSVMLDREEDKKIVDAKTLSTEFKATLKDRATISSAKDICNIAFGKDVYASTMLFGVAFQKGLLPFTLENVLDALNKTIRKDEIANNIQAFHIGRAIIEWGQEDILSRLNKVKHKAKTHHELARESILESLPMWQNRTILVDMFDRYLERLQKYHPKIKKKYLIRYLHDMFIYDRGVKAEDFITKAGELVHLYSNQEEQEIALRTLAKTYWVKDEVMVSHLMISPFKRSDDDFNYKNIGKSFKVSRFNRPSFDFFGKHIEFDISPNTFMLKVMRHMRILRLLMPSWHKKEKAISLKIRTKLLDEGRKIPEKDRRKFLKRLENIKGYREIRYKKAYEVLGDF